MQSPPGNLFIMGEQNGFPRPFGNYLLLAAFAQGGMGELFLAMNGSIAGAFRLCVVKKLRADLTNDQEYVNRFIDEARVVAQLNHANISHVFDVGRLEGQYYLAMEYVSGVSVKKLMSRAQELNEPIPEEIAIFIAREVLEALDYAHSHTHPITGEPLHVVHRDVSPQNMLVSWAGEVKLIDFGLALSALKDEHTATGAVMGKVAYMPPEQARGDEVGPSCDQFATAVVSYEMIAGDRYHGDLPLHAIWAIAGMGNFPPPKWSKLPGELQVILQRALHNDPFRRYDTCGDLREALGAYMAAHHPTTSERSVRDLLEKWFKDYRAQEREILAQFKDVTGGQIREAVKATETTAESLLSGPHQRKDMWQLPPTEQDWRAVVSKSGPASPAPAKPAVPAGRFDESRSMPLMPPPAAGPQDAESLARAAAALLGPPSALPAPVPPLSKSGVVGPPVMTPLAPPRTVTPGVPMATVGEHTEQYLRERPVAPPPSTLGTLTPHATVGEPSQLVPVSTPLAALTPHATVAEHTAQFLRGAGPQQPVGTLTPHATVAERTEQFRRATGAPVEPLPTLTPVTSAVAQPVVDREPTERVQRRGPMGTAAADAGDDDDLSFMPGRRPVWPWVAAAASALVAVVAVVIAVGSHGGSPPPSDAPSGHETPTVAATPSPPNAASPNAASPNAASPTPPPTTAAPTTATPTAPSAASTHHGHATAAHGGRAHADTHDAKPPETKPPETKPPETKPDNGADDGESEAARRARDRVDTLKRSACKDPCVGRIVGQLETMPNAVGLAGFRTSVDACIDACRSH